jgi:medium-chain acyl-[acyl-carrier-protein] hydrolase
MYLAHLPGRGGRFAEKPFTSLHCLVDRLGENIHDKLHLPFAFYGHSMGALIAFELARELRRRDNVEPAQLFVSGRCAPHVIRSGPPKFNLADQQFVAEIRKLNGTPLELLENPQVADLFVPVLRADFQMVETYKCEPERPLSCPILAYGGFDDKNVSLEELQAWKEFTTGTFISRLFPGDHFFIHSAKDEFLEVLRVDMLRLLRNLA